MANGNGISRQSAAIIALLGIAGGGGAGTLSGAARVDKKVERLEERLNTADTERAVILNEVKHIKEDQDEIIDILREIEDKID